jgi:hypothetical protein
VTNRQHISKTLEQAFRRLDIEAANEDLEILKRGSEFPISPEAEKLREERLQLVIRRLNMASWFR